MYICPFIAACTVDAARLPGIMRRRERIAHGRAGFGIEFPCGWMEKVRGNSRCCVWFYGLEHACAHAHVRVRVHVLVSVARHL